MIFSSVWLEARVKSPCLVVSLSTKMLCRSGLPNRRANNMDDGIKPGQRIKRQNANDVTSSYDTTLYSNNEGMWTVYETVKRPAANVADGKSANRLIALLQKGGA